MKKNYIILAILGSVWGIVELQLGTLLHSTKLPFVGLIMMAIGIFFQTAARRVTAMRGSALLVAVVVSFVKLLFTGGIAVATVVAIFIQSTFLEIIYGVREPSRVRMSIAAGIAVSYSLVHPFLSMPILMGLTFADAYHRVTLAGSYLFAGSTKSGPLILSGLLLLHFLVGFLAGHFSFSAVAKLRVGRLEETRKTDE